MQKIFIKMRRGCMHLWKYIESDTYAGWKASIEKQMEAVEEVIEMAVKVIGKRAPERDILIDIPEEMLLVPMDARLIGQVLVNLLDNAVKHTKVEEEIRLTVSVDEKEKKQCFQLLTRARELQRKIFRMF